MLAFEQMMQRQRLRGTVGPGAIGLHPARDDLGCSRDGFQLRLEGGRFLAIGMAQSLVARRELDDVSSRLVVLGARAFTTLRKISL